MQNESSPLHRTISCGDGCVISAEIDVPGGAVGVVVFVDGLSSGKAGFEDAFMCGRFRAGGFATVILNPSVPPIGFDPDRVSRDRRRSVIDCGVTCLIDITHWLATDDQTEGLGVGYFASDGGAAVALIAAADLCQGVQAVVSVSGRPDLAGNALEWVQTPTLLIAAEDDCNVVAFNEIACDFLEGEKELELLAGARCHGDSTAVLMEASELALSWFQEHLGEPV